MNTTVHFIQLAGAMSIVVTTYFFLLAPHFWAENKWSGKKFKKFVRAALRILMEKTPVLMCRKSRKSPFLGDCPLDRRREIADIWTQKLRVLVWRAE